MRNTIKTLAIPAMLGVLGAAFVTMPAQADDDWRGHDRHDWQEHREHEHDWQEHREHERREWYEHGWREYPNYYAPAPINAYYYPPPVVTYAPQPYYNPGVTFYLGD